jgi:predicted Rossmann fold flavoprotein
VLACERRDGLFHVTTNERTLRAESLVITTGGLSYPGCGTTGDGYGWAAGFGHTIVPTRPALTPITTSEAWVPGLQGITVPDVGLRVLAPTASPESMAGRSGGALAEGRGSFLFAHFGLSGPVVLDVSRWVSGHATPASLRLECDFLPRWTDAQWLEILRDMVAREGKRALWAWLVEMLPKRLISVLLSRAEVPDDRRLAELSNVERQRLLAAFKHQTLRVQGTRGYKKAEVTAGGVSLDEVDSRNMESKIVPKLFFAGEILDLDGPIGGFNFQAAFSTGWLAGEHA